MRRRPRRRRVWNGSSGLYQSSSPITSVVSSVVRHRVPLAKSVGPHPAQCDWVSYLRFRAADGRRNRLMRTGFWWRSPAFSKGGAFESIAKNTIVKAAKQGKAHRVLGTRPSVELPGRPPPGLKPATRRSRSMSPRTTTSRKATGRQEVYRVHQQYRQRHQVPVAEECRRKADARRPVRHHESRHS